jgi:hypothetical protein
MIWSYRLVDFGTHLGLCEVYYDEAGKPKLWSDPVSITGDMAEEIAEDLELMREAIGRLPALKASELP